jgi:hypothetical protein
MGRECRWHSSSEKIIKILEHLPAQTPHPPSAETPLPLGIDLARFSLRRIITRLFAEISVDLISTCRSLSDAQRTGCPRRARRRTMATERDAAQGRTRRPLSHGACKEPASPAPSLPRHVLVARRRANPRATARCLRPPPDLLPRRRRATALASIKPLASLRLAGCYLSTSCTTPSRGEAASRLSLSCHRRPRQRRLLLYPSFLALCPPPAPSAIKLPTATAAALVDSS